MASLTPEQLAQLQALNAAGNSGWSPYGQFSQDGQTYAPMVSYGQGMDNVGNNDLQGYMSYDPNHMKVGDPFQAYGKDGADAGVRQFQNATPISDFLIPLGAALAMGTMLPGMTGGAGGGLGAAVDPMMYGGTGAETWGAGAGATGAGGAGAAGAAGGGGGGGGYTMGSELFPGTTIPSSTIPGLSGMTPIGAGAGSGLLGSVASTLGMSPGTLTGLLSLGGGLLGSQGVKTTETTDKSPWAPLIPYIQKQLDYGGGLLDRSMSPENLQQADWIRQTGVGMLMPQQQNAFSHFFPGR